MGFEDRHYTREQSTYGQRPGLAQFSIITILIAINVIVWLADAFTPVVGGDATHWLSDNLTALRFNQPYKIWTFLTYGFTHAAIDSKISFWHIGGNMLVLFFLGKPVAQLLGRYEFLRFYLGAILISGLGWFLWTLLFERAGGVVGASGAVSAILAYFAMRFPHQKLLIWGILPMPAWILGLLLVGQDLFRAFDPNSHVAWQAHLAGAAFGAAYFWFKWDLRWLGNITGSLGAMAASKKTNLKVHSPDNNSGDEKFKKQADDILAKISQQGEQSLTRKERKILEKYSKSLRDKK